MRRSTEEPGDESVHADGARPGCVKFMDLRQRALAAGQRRARRDVQWNELPLIQARAKEVQSMGTDVLAGRMAQPVARRGSL